MQHRRAVKGVEPRSKSCAGVWKKRELSRKKGEGREEKDEMTENWEKLEDLVYIIGRERERSIFSSIWF